MICKVLSTLRARFCYGATDVVHHFREPAMLFTPPPGLSVMQPPSVSFSPSGQLGFSCCSPRIRILTKHAKPKAIQAPDPVAAVEDPVHVVLQQHLALQLDIHVAAALHEVKQFCSGLERSTLYEVVLRRARDILAHFRHGEEAPLQIAVQILLCSAPASTFSRRCLRCASDPP